MKKGYLLTVFIIGLVFLNCGLFAQEKPAKTKIIFSSFRSVPLLGNWELWSINPDGTGLEQLTDTLEDEIFAAASPDGKTIAYSNNKGEIWLWDLNSGERSRVPVTLEKLDQPAFSFDGRFFAFTNYRPVVPEDSDIWIIEMDELGKLGPRRLNIQEGLQEFPCFSPGGQRLIYSSGKRVSPTQVNEEIWMINLDGSGATQITKSEGIDFQPRWSADGQKIVFASNRTGNYDLWIMDTDGENQKQLTISEFYDAQPCFSPDGKKIVFVSTRGGYRQLWLMDINGGNLRPLTKEPFDCMNPCWLISEHRAPNNETE